MTDVGLKSIKMDIMTNSKSLHREETYGWSPLGNAADQKHS